jgi:hypothetical protein
MGRQELPTRADPEFENCEQEEDGVSTDQTAQSSTADEGTLGEEGGVEEVGMEEHRSQVEEDGEDDGESESGMWGHSPLSEHVHGNNPTQLSKARGSPELRDEDDRQAKEAEEMESR